MRKQIRFDHTENMFGHSYSYQLPDSDKVTVLENHELNWKVNHKRVTKPFFWFRAPKISVAQLAVTMQDVCNLGAPYELKVWNSDKGLDASLKISDDMDAAQWAWGHTEMWAKWSDDQEKEFIASLKSRKAPKLKVDKHGNIKVKVTVSQISDP